MSMYKTNAKVLSKCQSTKQMPKYIANAKGVHKFAAMNNQIHGRKHLLSTCTCSLHESFYSSSEHVEEVSTMYFWAKIFVCYSCTRKCQLPKRPMWGFLKFLSQQTNKSPLPEGGEGRL